MTVISARVRGDCVDSGDMDRIAQAVARLLPGQPVTIMVHGFRYNPAHPLTDPARDLFAPGPSAGPELSWPRHLGYREGAGPGVAIGLAWPATASIIAAHHRAERTGHALAALVATIRRHAPAARINAIGHSLGARVILHALSRLPADHLSRAVLLCAAAFRSDADLALASPAGRACEIVNVTTRENDLFDFIMEFALTAGYGRTIGLGLDAPPALWLDLQIDSARVLAGLATLGFPIASARRRICHWSAYSRPGIFALYRALLTDPVPLPLALLARHAVLPQEPRWSRLFTRPLGALPLPFRRSTPS